MRENEGGQASQDRSERFARCRVSARSSILALWSRSKTDLEGSTRVEAGKSS